MKRYIYFIILSTFLLSCGGSSSTTFEDNVTESPTTSPRGEDTQVCTLAEAEAILLDEGYEIDLTQEPTASNGLITKIDEECSSIVARELIVELNGFSIQTIAIAATETPTAVPTETPTETPTAVPTETPTETPTAVPTETPTETPTTVPTETPTETPTAVPTETPTETPTAVPTETPTETPTAVPTETPTETPTTVPTETPTPIVDIIEDIEVEGYSLLKATGQISPYADENGTLYKDDGYYQVGIAQNNDSSEDIYEAISNNMLYDKITGLTWYNSEQEGTISDAMQVCADKGYGGEWRVPTIKELMTLMMYQYISPTVHPTIYNTLFKYFDVYDQERINRSMTIVSQDYISNGQFNTLYYARFGTASVELFDSYDRESIFCVSGDNTYTSALYEHGTDYMKDTTHHLMWEDQSINRINKMNWFDALEYCEDLELAGYDDWRLPNINEVMSIYDNSNSNFTIGNFNYAPTGIGLWSSTYYPQNNQYVYAGMLNFGIIKYIQRTSETYVRCIRSDIDPNQEKITSTSTKAPEQDSSDPSVALPTW